MSDELSNATRIAALEDQVLQLTADIATERERCGVLEREVRAARVLGDASPLAMTFAKQQWVDARNETDTRHALDAAKFVGGG